MCNAHRATSLLWRVRITNWSQEARGYGLRVQGATVPRSSGRTPSEIFRLSGVGTPRAPLGAERQGGLIAVALPIHNRYSIVAARVAAQRRYGLINERPAAIPLTSDASPPEYAGRFVSRRAKPPTSSRDLGRGDVALAGRG